MTQIGRYEIVRRTGQTPLGTIYEAVDSQTRRTVAIQSTATSVNYELPAEWGVRTALEESSETLGRLKHPNIRNLLAVEHADGRLFLVMEHLDATPLAKYVALHKTQPAELVSILKTAAVALDYAHDNGVIHPGLTPAHLLIDANSVLKIAGFEIPGLDALSFKVPSDAERTGLENSTPYRAPELLCGEGKDGRVDQFALAAIAYELLTGFRLFQYSSAAQTMAAILLGKLPDFSALEMKTNAAFRRVLERSLAPDPAQRYGSCAQMTTAMETAVVRKSAAAPTRITDSSFKAPGGLGMQQQQPAPLRRSTPAQVNIPEKVARVKHTNSRRMAWVVAGFVFAVLAVAALILTQVPREQHLVSQPQPPLHVDQPIKSEAEHEKSDRDPVNEALKRLRSEPPPPTKPVGTPHVTSPAPEGSRPKKPISKPRQTLDDMILPDLQQDLQKKVEQMKQEQPPPQ